MGRGETWGRFDFNTAAALRFPAPSGPPIAPLPRNRLAFSAAGGASPLSSSPQNPLRWAFVGAPIGCAEKRKRLLMVSREKTLAAAFQTSFETPFPACYGGYWGADSRACVHSTAYAGSEAEGASVCPLLLFCCRTLEVAEDWCRGGSGWPLLLIC